MKENTEGFTPKKVLKLARRLSATAELTPTAVQKAVTETVHLQDKEKPKR